MKNLKKYAHKRLTYNGVVELIHKKFGLDKNKND